MIITFRHDFNSFNIYFDSILQFTIKRGDIISVQAYRVDNLLYTIEYHLKDRDVITEYENREHWVMILKEIDRIGI